MTAIGSWVRNPVLDLAPSTVVGRHHRLPSRALDRDGGAGGVGPWWTRPSVVVPVAAALLAAAVIAVVLGRAGQRPPGIGEAIVTVSGSASVRRHGGGAETVTGRTRLEPGDQIELRKGTARFELADGVAYEALIRSGEAEPSVLMASVPQLRAGELLVEAPRGAKVRVGAAETRLSRGTVARLGRSYASRTGVYRGMADISTAGTTARVARLRSAEVITAGEIGRHSPLAVDAADRWDRRYLGDAIGLDSDLAALSRGMRAGGTDPVTLLGAVRRHLSNSPSAATVKRLVADRAGRLDASIAVAVIGNGTRGSLGERWARGIRFHDAGASWGLVASDIGADPDAVTATLRAALDRPEVVAATERASVGRSGGNGRASGSAGGGQVATTPGLGGSANFGSGSGAASTGTGPTIGGAPGVGSTGPPGSASAPGPGQSSGPSGTVAPGAGGGSIAGSGGIRPGGGGPGGSPNPGGSGQSGGSDGSGPAVTLPPVTTPGVGTPPVTLPGVSIPPVTVPSVTVPHVTIPPVTIPGVLPPVTIPHVSIPPVLPPVTIPHVSIPPVLPPVTLPPVTIPPVLHGVTGTVGGLLGGR